MERLFILLCFLLVGCHTDFHRIHVAAGSTSFLARNLQSEGEPISYLEASLKNGHTLDIYRELVADGMYGPRVGIPLTDREDGAILGLDIEARLRWDREGVQPYVGFHVGTAYFTERWEEQGTNWGFTLGPVVGFKKDWWFVEYRYWHESNGTKAFGHDKGPNPGFNASLLSIGVEW